MSSFDLSSLASIGSSFENFGNNLIDEINNSRSSNSNSFSSTTSRGSDGADGSIVINGRSINGRPGQDGANGANGGDVVVTGGTIINGRLGQNGADGASVFNGGSFSTAGSPGTNIIGRGINGVGIGNINGVSNSRGISINGNNSPSPEEIAQVKAQLSPLLLSLGRSQSDIDSIFGGSSSTGTDAQPNVSSSRSFLASFNRG